MDSLELLDLAHCKEGLNVFELLSSGIDLEDLDIFLLQLPLFGKLELGNVHVLEGHVDELLATVCCALVQGSYLHDLRGEIANKLSFLVFLNGCLDVLDVGPVDRSKVFEADFPSNDVVSQHLRDVCSCFAESFHCVLVIAILNLSNFAVVKSLNLILIHSCLDSHFFLA